MDVQTIDQEYAQLEAEAQDTSVKLQALAGKMQTAAAGGDANAREWMLDLKEIALAVRDEERQVAAVLQALHAYAANTLQPQPPAGQVPPSPAGYPQPGYPPQQPYGSQPGYPPMAGGLQGFLGSGFGRAVTMGLGFGLGDDLINKLF